MATTTATQKKLRALAFAGIAASAVFASPRDAHAEPVTPTAKGTIGGAFLGGEVVVFGEALFGVRSTAAYLVGAGVGVVGGGVGGFFIEKAVDDGRIPAYLLAGGLALLIPAIVITLDATRFMPTEGARDDKPVNAPVSDPGNPSGSSVVGAEPGATTPAATPAPADTTAPPTTPPPAPATPTPPSGGAPAPTQAPQAMRRPNAAGRATAPSLIGMQDGSLFVGVPVPEVRPILGATERVRMGADNRGSEVRFPVVHVSF